MIKPYNLKQSLLIRFEGKLLLWRYLRIWILLFVCYLLSLSAVSAGYPDSDNSSSLNLQKVTLQLRWDNQYQFAGYYAAKWNGYYRDAGFDVDIRSAITPEGKIISATQEVGNGTADFGVGAADILIARDKGIPLVVLASIFQQSAAEFYALNNTHLQAPVDLLNLKVARNVNDLIDVELQAMLHSEGINPNNITAYSHFTGIQHLVDGRVDVIPGYRISAPLEFKQQGFDTKVLRPINYGIDFYGDSLFTTSKLVEQDPEAVERFTQASIQGWEYALEHPEEIADKISHELPRIAVIQNGTFRDFNRFQIAGVKELTLYPIIDVGHINPDRWRRMNEVIQHLGLIKTPLNVDEFVFNHFNQDQKREKEIIFICIILILGTIGGVLIIYGWTFSLRKTIALKTRALRELNSKLDLDNEMLRRSEEERELLLSELAKNHEELNSSYQDLATQKEKLQTSEERYRTIVTNSHAGYFLIDNEGRYQMVNDAWLSMHGFSSSDEVIGQHFSITQIDEDQNYAQEQVERILHGITITSGEFSRRNRDGSIGYHSFSATPVIRNRNVIGLEGFLIDITQRKQMEEALFESNQKLRLLTGLTRHDIFNQLSAVQMLQDLALHTSDPAKCNEYISKAQEAGDQIEKTIGFTREYENFGIVSSGWQCVHVLIEGARTEVDVGTVVLQNQIPVNLEIYADPIIRKVFSTLMENSIRHGGEITTIQFSFNMRENLLTIICDDDGIGIPAEEKEHIFDHGFGKHTGIGLFLVREILSITGLSIRECGEPGKEARFEIIVPAGKHRSHQMDEK